MVKVVKENPYPKTTQLIYSQASERIAEKYNAWAERQPKRPAKVDVYSDTKLLTNVLGSGANSVRDDHLTSY